MQKAIQKIFILCSILFLITACDQQEFKKTFFTATVIKNPFTGDRKLKITSSMNGLIIQQIDKNNIAVNPPCFRKYFNEILNKGQSFTLTNLDDCSVSNYPVEVDSIKIFTNLGTIILELD